MKRIIILTIAFFGLLLQNVQASEVGGNISTGISTTGLEFSLPCTPASVTNGTVSSQTCVITCDSGYTLSSNTCIVTPSSGGGGGGGGGGSSISVFASGATVTNSGTTTIPVIGSGTITPTTPTSNSGTAPQPVVRVITTDIRGNWAVSYITTLIEGGYVNNSQNFKPDDSLTRAEFIKIVGNVSKWNLATASGTKIPFSDVSKTDWFAPYVQYAVANKVIRSSAAFNPNDRITRAEVSKILSIALKLNTEKYTGVFVDVPSTHSLALYVEAMKKAGIFGGQQKEWVGLIFRPDDNITRAEIAKVVVMGFDL